MTASPADWEQAYERYQRIHPLLCGTTDATDLPAARTLFRWLARYRAAERDLGCGYLGLLPQRKQQGNRTARLDPVVQALMDEVITTHYERSQRPGIQASYAILVKQCHEQKLTAPSYPTFAAAIHRRPRTEQLRKCQGKRAASQQQPFYWELTAQTPRHGDRPAHIDTPNWI